MKMFSNGKKNSSGAKVVDGRLLVSFPNAVKPVIWQTNISETKTSSFEVMPAATEGNFTISINSEGNKEVIATFSSEEEASQALIQIGEALETPQGYEAPKGYTKAAVPSSETKGGFLSFVTGIIGLLILAVLVWVLFSLTPHNISMNESSISPASNISSGMEQGKPISADQYLMGK